MQAILSSSTNRVLSTSLLSDWSPLVMPVPILIHTISLPHMHALTCMMYLRHLVLMFSFVTLLFVVSQRWAFLKGVPLLMILSISLLVFLSVYLSLSVCLCLSVCVHLCVSVSLCVSLFIPIRLLSSVFMRWPSCCSTTVQMATNPIRSTQRL